MTGEAADTGEIVSDDPQGGAPDVDGAPDEPRFVPTEELQARADAFDAATFGKPPAGAEGDGDAAPAPGAEPAAKTAVDPSIQAILAQNQELIRLLASRPEPGAEVQDPLAAAEAASPEIKQLDSDITSTTELNVALDQANRQIYAYLGTLEANVRELTGELRATPAEDALPVQSRLQEATQKRDAALAQMAENKRTIVTNNASLSGWKRERVATIKQLEQSVKDQQKQNAEVEQDKVATVTEYDGAFTEEAKAHGIEPGSKTFSKLHQSIKAEIRAYLSTRDPEEPGLDITAAVKHLFKEAAETFNLGARRTLASASAAKLANRASVSPRGTRLPASSAAVGGFPRKPTLEEVRARRDAILRGGDAR